MNDYIKNKIDKGKLKDKKFEIQIYDGILTYHHLEVTQGKNGYFVSLSDYPTLEELISIVDYFTKPDWKPFLSSEDYYTVDSKVIQKRIDNFYKRNVVNEIIPYQPFMVWEKDGVSLQYSDDRLKYLINDVHLSFQPTSSLPIKIRDRYLFFQNDSIFVVQDMQTIKSLKVEESYNYSEDWDIYVFSQWVNICMGGEDNWVYSYSYDKNKFYRRKEWK